MIIVFENMVYTPKSHKIRRVEQQPTSGDGGHCELKISTAVILGNFLRGYLLGLQLTFLKIAAFIDVFEVGTMFDLD